MNKIITGEGTQYWLNERKQYHREDGPAFIGIDGHQEWWINGKRHRTDGPAYIGYNGDNKSWYVNNKLCFDNKSYQKAANLSDEDMTAMMLKYGDVK